MKNNTFNPTVAPRYTRRTVKTQAALLIIIAASVAIFPDPASAGMIVHPHGPAWTSWEKDKDKGIGTVWHSHPAPGGSENGDEAHQHYIVEDFGGRLNQSEIFSAFGAWIDRTGYIDNTNPFANQGEYRAWHVPHGWIDVKPRYQFVGAVWGTDPKAKQAKTSIETAFSEWSKIRAHRSPATSKGLITGFGFEPATGNQAEIRIMWSDIDDSSGGGVTGNLTRGAHTHTNPFTLTFDSSYDWDFTRSGLLADPTKWHFFSVAMHEVGHLVFLEHQRDKDLMDPSVGEPIHKDINKDPEKDGSYRWSFYLDNPGENDYFTGWHGSWDAISSSYVYTPITDKDSVDGVKSLYSVPVPEPSSIILFGAGLAMVSLGRYSRRLRRQKDA